MMPEVQKILLILSISENTVLHFTVLAEKKIVSIVSFFMFLKICNTLYVKNTDVQLPIVIERSCL